MNVSSFALVALALFLWAVPAWAYGPNGEEDRCTQLGSNCLVSEPLNTNAYASLGNRLFNPGDTTGATQCTTFFAGNLIPATESYAEAALTSNGYGDTMPAGNQVTYVQKTSNSAASFAHVQGKSTGAGIRRMCQRHYYMRANGSSFSSGNVKDMEFSVGSCEFIWGNCSHGTEMCFISRLPGVCGNGFCDNASAATYSKPECVGTGSLNQNSCVGHWCRVEMCAYGALTGTGNVYTEGYVVRVDNPTIRRDYAPANYGDLPVDGTGTSQINGLFWGFSPDPPQSPGRMVSHAMQAAWSTDSPRTFIGPAYEIEGGTGTTPPPPSPVAPPPPVLLP